MRYLILLLSLGSTSAYAADINLTNLISCIGEDTALKGSHQKNTTKKASGEVKQRFSEWLLAENFSEYKSRLKFLWTPGDSYKPKIEIFTTEKNHHQVEIRSLRNSSLIVVSNASDPFFTWKAGLLHSIFESNR